MLFSEEDLTRNLQIVLRTFDDLNFRQEQRFHLELGLLKLIHAQRLLPLEELLSGVAGGGVSRPTASAPASRPAPPAPRASAAPAPAVPSTPTLSPFTGGSASVQPEDKHREHPRSGADDRNALSAHYAISCSRCSGSRICVRIC